MSGHSKWHTIKHKKGATDAKRGRVFTRIIKELTVAARAGGGDPDTNPRLRTIVAEAKQANMPAENIKRAIRRGTGEEPGVQYEEITYEGYGPGGVAVLVEVMTDNRNRIVAEVRHIFSKYGGNLAENGAVSWIFSKKGSILIDKKGVSEDALMELALDAGAEDVRVEESEFEVITDPASFEAVKRAVDGAGIKCIEAKVSLIPSNTVELGEAKAASMLKLMERMEDNDDVQNVYANFDIPDAIMEKLS